MKYLKKIFENINNQIIIIRCDDWEGAYYNNKLLNQGHSIRWEEVLNQLGYNTEYKNISNEDMEDLQFFPENIKDVETFLTSKKYNL